MDDSIQQLTRLFSLLLGFGIAEVLRGLARVWRIKAGAEVRDAKIRVGLLVPLLGLLVILDQTSFVITAVELQDQMGYSYLSMLAIMVVVGGYYLVSTFVFPARPREWHDFNRYYDHIHRTVCGGILAINLAILLFEAAREIGGADLPEMWGAGGSGMGVGNPAMLAAEIVFLAIIAMLAWVRSTRIAFAGLVAANGLILLEALWPVVMGDIHVSGPRNPAQVQGLFALLIGMSIAVLLGGLARCWRIATHVESRHASIRIGSLVPLLGLLLALDQIDFFMSAVKFSASTPFNYASLLSVVVVIGGYYAISTFVFPDQPQEWPDHDDYYLKMNRTVLGGMILINVATIIVSIALSVAGFETDVTTGSQGGNTLGGAIIALVAALMFPPVLITLYFVKSARKNLVLLISANLLMVIGALAEIA